MWLVRPLPLKPNLIRPITDVGGVGALHFPQPRGKSSLDRLVFAIVLRHLKGILS
jgi:hypothetical protein